MNENVKLLKEIAEELYEEQEGCSEWSRGPLEKLNQLKPDYAGKAGEKFALKKLQSIGLEVEYQEDQIDTEAVYDLKIQGKKVEWKTARQGKQKGFQHENLRKNCNTELYAFLDIYPDSRMIFAVLKKEEMQWNCKNQLTGRKPHLRKGADDQYKYDFGVSTHDKLLENKIAIDLSKSTDYEILDFLEKRGIL